MAQPFLSVIIPAYNEAERLPLTLIDVDKRLSREPYSYEILVMNDGSKDNTAGVVCKMEKAVKNLKLVDNRENKGKGGVVRQGMLVSRGRYRLFMDADNSVSVDHFDSMIPHFKEGYGVVICSREMRGSELVPPQPFHKRLLGRLSNIVIQLTNVPGIWDTQCGFKAFTAEAAEKIFSAVRVNGWGFDIEVLALARKLGYRIKEIQVRWVNDPRTHVKLSGYLKTFVENAKIRWWLWTGKYGI